MLNATLCQHDYTKLPSFHVHDKFFCYALKLSTQIQHTLICPLDRLRHVAIKHLFYAFHELSQNVFI